MRATWLRDVLRAEGLHVVEMDGWETRESRGGFNPQGVVLHHTATPKSAKDLSVRRILRDGRPDLKGPLCQLGLERDGTFVLVAAGRANHAGYGTPWGNDSIGIEAYNDGQGEPWPPAQIDAWIRGCAAICRHQGWDPPARIKGHREVDPHRKIDPLNIDLDRFRRDVTAALTPEDDMPLSEAEWTRLGALITEATGTRSKVNVADRSEVWRWTRETVIGVRALLGKADDVDEDAIAAAVLAGLDPAAIAAAIPADLAEKVADELAARLAG